MTRTGWAYTLGGLAILILFAWVVYELQYNIRHAGEETRDLCADLGAEYRDDPRPMCIDEKTRVILYDSGAGS